MYVIDFHSHILPEIDDGSRSVDMSIKMLDICAENGVGLMVATPHFYADINSIENFLENRRLAYEKLAEARQTALPKIMLGAEVAYFDGIGHAEKIKSLLIEGTNTLLLEMPFEVWNDNVIEEIEYMIYKRDIRVVIAHIERFLKISGNKPYIKKLLTLPVIVQVNAGSLIDPKRRSTILKMIKKEQVHLLGSDCHDTKHRPPNLWLGRKIIEDKLGRNYTDQIDELGAVLLEI